jgi:hypothetical protein
MTYFLKRILAFILLLFVAWGGSASYANEIIKSPNLAVIINKKLKSVKPTKDGNQVIMQLLPGRYCLNQNLSIPEFVSLKVEPGAVILISQNNTLTVNGDLDACPHQIFSCRGTGKVVFTNNIKQKQIWPEWWKAPAESYWHSAIQKAIDAAETSKIPIFFSQDMSINGNLYLGNAPLISNNKTITIVADNKFATLGTGEVNWYAAIVAKSGTSAGYGLSTTTININGLNFFFNRTSCSGHWEAIALENCTGSIQNTGFITASNLTANEEATPLDFYRGVSDFVVNNCSFNLTFTGGRGGFWIRNHSTSKPTKNITVSNCIFRSSQWDEALAIFTTLDNNKISDVFIKGCKFYLTGNRDVALSTYMPDKTNASVTNVRWSDITVISDTPINGFIFYVSHFMGTLENITASMFYVETPTTSAGYDTKIMKGLTSLENCYVKVTGDTGTSNKLIIFSEINILRYCENAFTGSIARTPIAADSCGLIEYCSLIPPL